MGRKYSENFNCSREKIENEKIKETLLQNKYYYNERKNKTANSFSTNKKTFNRRLDFNQDTLDHRNKMIAISSPKKEQQKYPLQVNNPAVKPKLLKKILYNENIKISHRHDDVGVSINGIDSMAENSIRHCQKLVRKNLRPQNH